MISQSGVQLLTYSGEDEQADRRPLATSTQNPDREGLTDMKVRFANNRQQKFELTWKDTEHTEKWTFSRK
jgi:hypothetical protein